MVSLYTDTTLAEFTRDPAYSTGAHPLLGVVSNIGVLCWCAAATMCFMGTALLHRQGSDSPLRPFLLSAGLLTAALLLDDLFMLHDWFVVYELHMDEKLLFGAYGAAVVAFLVYFRAVILASEFLLLGLALCFFAFSAGESMHWRRRPSRCSTFTRMAPSSSASSAGSATSAEPR